MPNPPCPYCGQAPKSPDADRCDQCGGLFEPLSRQATQLAMGPWFVRDEERPFMPGFNEAILRQQVASGRVKADTIVRGPTTHQFWVLAEKAPGLSRLLGKCHACGAGVSSEAESCIICQADLSLIGDVDRLGLSYVELADRQQAQAEVTAMRTGQPAPPAPKKQPDTGPIDSDLLQPVAPDPAQDPDEQVHLESVALDTPAYEAPQTDALAEDLWQAGESSPVRRRKRKSGPDPIVLALGVMLMCVIGIGLFVMIAGGGDGDDDDSSAADNPNTPANQPIERTADQVAAQRMPVQNAFDQISSEGVPESFEEKLAAIKQLIDQADRDAEGERLNQAYDTLSQSRVELDALPAQIAQWQADEDARIELSMLTSRIDLLGSEAKAAEAERWAPTDFTAGQAAQAKAKPLGEAGEYATAGVALREAQTAYQKALDISKAGNAADTARNELNDATKAGDSQDMLRKFASDQVDLLLAKRSEGDELFNAQDYAKAASAYRDAMAALRSAEKTLELAKYRKVYAYNAGYSAADILLAIASGDGIDAEKHKELVDLFDQLSLPSNPASALTPGKEADYANAAKQLADTARDTITQAYGEQVQASYHVGFQARIIDQSLTTAALTDAQQKRIHQALNAFQDQAAVAGWDILKMRSVFDAVRNANRIAHLGEPPAQTRTAWDRLMSPFKNRETASRVMDPVISPSSPNDPELFPGLGSSHP